MRMMARNKREFYFSLYKEKVPKTDEYGNETGEYEIVRTNPIRFTANVSASKGEVNSQQFGESENYDKVIVMDNDAPSIDEYTVFWIDTIPMIDDTGFLAKDCDGNFITPHDYIVKKVAKSLNSTLIAISKVNVQ